MSTVTITQPEVNKRPRQKSLPPLQNGDHLTRTEFERRYAAQPQIKKAELIEGVVHMPSPVSVHHGNIHANIMTWLGNYRANTPGTYLADNATIRLDLENEVQPDATLYIAPEKGGQIEIEDKFLSGAPELVVEVAVSSAAYDLHEKLRVYRRNGVQEYLVLMAYEQETRWFQLIEGEYRLLTAAPDGVLRSHFFPGLYFHSEKFWSDDLAGLLEVLQAGLTTPAHEAFVSRLRLSPAT